MKYVRGWITKPPPTFILGVGAQKAGTSWLFQYLKRVRHSDMPGHKEFHVWDVLDFPSAQKYRSPEIPRHSHDARVRDMVEDPEKYFDFFSARLTESRITADITPNYAGLGVERLRMINDEFASRGIQVKSILLVRDPVSRCVSAFRMVRARRDARLSRQSSPADMDEAFLRYALSEDCEVRTRYESTWAANDEAFGADHVHVEFFESLFTEKALTRLDKFLCSHGWHKLRERQYNTASPDQTWQPQPDALAQVAHQYRSTYDYVLSRAPECRAAWRGFELLDN